MLLPCLVDTNILLRPTNPNHPHHSVAAAAIEILLDRGSTLYFTLQNASEFWNVCTRPREINGMGLSVAVTEHHLNTIEQNMTLLPDSASVYDHWRILLIQHSIRGVQVHDAKLAAAMLANDIAHILTFNADDFNRFSGITAIHPAEIVV